MRVTHRNHLNNALAEYKADADDDGKKGKQIMPYLARCVVLRAGPQKRLPQVLLNDLSPEADKTEVALWKRLSDRKLR
jgi:hypothetical protein